VADPGFRPTATAADAPIQPTAIAEPSAARPTWRLPPMCVPFLSMRLRGRRRAVLRMYRGLLVVLTEQQGEDRGQQHEHQRLHDPDEQFEKIKRPRHEPADPRHARHRFEHRLARADVAGEPEAE